nr:TolC family protein [Pedobacter antarcticus]
MEIRFIYIGFFFLLSAHAMAQQNHSISLDESKKAALEYSRVIQNSELGIQSAEAGKKGAAANYLPSVSATGIGLYNFKDFISAMPPLLTEGVNNAYFAGVTATEVLYAGGKIRTANELAAMQIEVNKIRAKQSRDSVLLQTENKYWTLNKLQEQHKTLTANETYLNGILKQQEDLLASGLIARNDLLKVKVQRSKLLLEKSKLNNGRKVAILDFCFFIGIPFDSLLVMRDGLDTARIPSIDAQAPDLDLSANNDYQLLQKSLESEQLQTKMTRANYLPSVSLGFSAGRVGSISNSLGSTFMPIAFGVVNVPISDWWGTGKQKLRQRTISEKIAGNRFKDGEDQLKVGILKSWYDLEDAQNKFVLLKKTTSRLQRTLLSPEIITPAA